MKNLEMNISFEIDIEDLVTALIDQYTQDELIEMIGDIDAEVAELDFTKRLKDHFDEEYHREKAIIEEEKALEEAHSLQFKDE